MNKKQQQQRMHEIRNDKIHESTLISSQERHQKISMMTQHKHDTALYTQNNTMDR